MAKQYEVTFITAEVKCKSFYDTFHIAIPSKFDLDYLDQFAF